MRPADDGFFTSNICVGGLGGGTGLMPAKKVTEKCCYQSDQIHVPCHKSGQTDQNFPPFP